MNFIENLKNALLNRQGEIESNLILNNQSQLDFNDELRNIKLPKSVQNFYREITYIEISKPRHFEILAPSQFELLDSNFLLFSNINNNKICFDLRNINVAGEWDIICINNNYGITKTLSSYLTNKIWAWVDRGRPIYEMEFLD